MKKTKLLLIAIVLFLSSSMLANAGQSLVVVADGESCMGLDQSRHQTERLAINEAKRNASESASTDIKSQTLVKDAEVQSDLMRAFAHATVRLINTVHKEWINQQGVGECYHVRIQAEVTPQKEAMEKVANHTAMDDPTKPLKVRIWSDKRAYKQGDRMTLYIKGNKPFYGRVVYQEISGQHIQLLPNPFRQDNYFQGGVTYSLPAGNDRFDLEVSPPFGSEQVTVYASTQPSGSNLHVQNVGSVYVVKTKPEDISMHTRGIKLIDKHSEKTTASTAVRPSEFCETTVTLVTGQ